MNTTTTTPLAAALAAFDEDAGRQLVGLTPHRDLVELVDEVTAAAQAAGVWAPLVEDWQEQTARVRRFPALQLFADRLIDARDALETEINHSAANAASLRVQAAQQAVRAQERAIAAATAAHQFEAIAILRRELELELRHEMEVAEVDVLTFRAQVDEKLKELLRRRRETGAAQYEAIVARQHEVEKQAEAIGREASAVHKLTRSVVERDQARRGAADRSRAAAKTAAASLPTKEQRATTYAGRVA